MSHRTPFLITLLLPILAATPALAQSRASAPEARVVGGTPTTTPWPAQGQLQTPLGSCGATLVSGRRVLTAAHCVTDAAGAVFAPGSLSIILGRSELTGASPSGTYGVAAGGVLRHAAFQRTNAGMTNDLAVLRLDRAAPFEPLRLITPQETALWSPGTIATVLGWGRTCADTCPTVTQLQQAGVPIVADATCATDYAPFPGSFDAGTMVCAGNEETDTCQGDSGGPLMVPRLDTFVLTGVTSWGVGCADARYPGVYVRLGVPALNTWVRTRVPTATITVTPPVPSPGQNVGLSASATHPTSGMVPSFSWDLDDDGQYDDKTGATANLPAISAGSHVVRVQAQYSDMDRALARDVVTTAGSPPPAPPPPPPPPPKPAPAPSPAPALAAPAAAATTTAPVTTATSTEEAPRAEGSSVAVAPLFGVVSVPARVRLRTLRGRRLSIRVSCAAACTVQARLVLDPASSKRAGLTRRAGLSATVGRGRDLRTRATSFNLAILLTRRSLKALKGLQRAKLGLRISATGSGTRGTMVERSISYLR